MRLSLSLSLLAVASLVAGNLAAQIPANVEFRVPKPPTVAAGDSGAFLTYELHISNLAPVVVVLKRVDVVNGADTSRGLLSVADSALLRIVTHPGSMVPPSERLRIAGGSRANLYLWIPVDKNNPPATLRHRLTIQVLAPPDSATQVLDGALTPVERQAVRIRPPLRGEWLAGNGPSNQSGHRRTALALNGTVAIGQRFAIDFLQVDDSGRTWRPGADTNNKSYYAYGKDIISVGDGVVVETKDSIPENSPRSPVARAVPINLITVAGNHIVVDMGQGHYAFYAHVQPGSLRVRVGDRVRSGQVLALLGNSGNSTEPHLHFHIVDAVASGTSTLGAEGIPYATSFDVIGRCTLSAAGIKCARNSPITVRDGIPLQNQLVRFP
jgi:murein DD-endopeptidase